MPRRSALLSRALTARTRRAARGWPRRVGRLSARLDVQFLSERAPARLVLRQSGAALAVLCQQAHQPPVCLFLPGFQFNLTPGVPAGLVQIAAGLAHVYQAAQGQGSLSPKAVAHQERPLFKGCAVRKRKPFQERTAIEGDGLLVIRPVRRHPGPSVRTKSSRWSPARLNWRVWGVTQRKGGVACGPGSSCAGLRARGGGCPAPTGRASWATGARPGSPGDAGGPIPRPGRPAARAPGRLKAGHRFSVQRYLERARAGYGQVGHRSSFQMVRALRCVRRGSVAIVPHFCRSRNRVGEGVRLYLGALGAVCHCEPRFRVRWLPAAAIPGALRTIILHLKVPWGLLRRRGSPRNDKLSFQTFSRTLSRPRPGILDVTVGADPTARRTRTRRERQM